MRLILAGFSLAALTGCASTGASTDLTDALSEITGQNGRACVDQRDIQGFGLVSNRTLSINTRTSSYYLATTQLACDPLGVDVRGAFGGRFSETCGGRGDRFNTASGSCQIKAIYRFDSREAAFAAADEAKALAARVED
ncbi:hypothetical protein HK107_04260 [Parvularcula sp. ZS-1/3]|uniref:Uncharacterized protein n=1 Tax=Parvularcula mediterranea TaxID=2732508 RepID=A0A7Y3W4T0_9PROT|nr:DUF6491 family protein [Parvularcula mediterranea]NNU15531.1 hypothetical protein [Parvularcula mediterranea]